MKLNVLPLLFAAVLITGLAACGPADTPEDEPSVVPQDPEIAQFTAAPAEIAQGEDSTLTWQVEGDDVTLIIDNEVGDVTGEASATVSPAETTTYRLLATNSAGDDAQTVTVSVVEDEPADAPVISSFGANPAEITAGDASVLSWELTGGAPTSVTIDNGVGEVGGNFSTTVTPEETTTYTLTATNNAGEDTATATLEVSAPVTIPEPVLLAQDDEVALSVDELFAEIDVLENDTVPEGFQSSFEVASEPSNGQAAAEDGVIFYQAEEDFTGEVTFEYTLTGFNPDTDTTLIDTATVTVTVTE